MSLSGRANLSPFDVLQTYVPTTTADKVMEAGATGTTPDGRAFKMAYILASGSSLVTNKLVQGPAVNSNLQGATCSTQSIGDTSMTLTFTSTTFSANVFAGGFIGIITGTGSVQTLQIKSHPAVTSGTTCLFQLVDPVYIATASSPTANVWANPYYGVIAYTGSVTGTYAGVPLVAATVDATYGTFVWLQTNGLAVILGQGSVGAGLGLQASTIVAGAFAAAASTGAKLATASQATTDATYSFADLNIAS